MFALTLARRQRLAGLLESLPVSVATAYLLDDMVVQGSSPEHFARLSGYRGRLILVNDLVPIRGCTADSATQPRQYRLTRSGADTVLDYCAPECFQRT